MAHRPWGPRSQARSRRILKRCTERSGVEPAQFLLPLRVGEELTIAGKLEVRVVRGAVEIWGALLHPALKFRSIVVPAWAGLPRLRAVRRQPQLELEGVTSRAKGEDSDVAQFLEHHHSAVVICLRVVDRVDAELPNVSPFHALRTALYPPGELPRLRAHRVWPSIADRLIQLHTMSNLGEPPGLIMVTGPKGVGKSECCRYFVNALMHTTGHVCFLETDLGQPEFGPPGLVGLHLVRSPIFQAAQTKQSSHECVASFFAGGVTPSVDPILYIKCVRAAFRSYLQLCSSHFGATPPPPLVVNTHGWVTGLGRDLVRMIFVIVKAQLVIRIHTTPQEPTSPAPAGNKCADSGSAPEEHLGRKRLRQSERFPLVKHARTAASKCGPLAIALRSASGVHADEDIVGAVMVDLESMTSAEAVVEGRHGAPSAAELRWMRFSRYFRPDLDICRPPAGSTARCFFEKVPRARLSLNSLRFGLLHGPLACTEVEVAFTGMAVALCAVGGGVSLSHTMTSARRADGVVDSHALAGGAADYIAAEASSRCWSSSAATQETVLHSELACLDADAPRCVAVAFVHSFDFNKGELIVHTPASAVSIAEANVVLRGDVTWEPQATLGHRAQVRLSASMGASLPASPLQPYFCAWALEGMGRGARVVSMRQNLWRKRLRPAGVLGHRENGGQN